MSFLLQKQSKNKEKAQKNLQVKNKNAKIVEISHFVIK